MALLQASGGPSRTAVSTLSSGIALILALCLSTSLLLAPGIDAASASEGSSSQLAAWKSGQTLSALSARQLSASRKLLQATLTRDYTAFCTQYQGRYRDFVPVFEVPFDDDVDFISAIDVCNLIGFETPLAGQNLFTPTLTGTFTEETIPKGRRLSLHIEGSGVFASGASLVPVRNPTIERFVGVNPVQQANFPVLTKEELSLVLATATSFSYFLVWEMTDGTSLGDPVTISYANISNPKYATLLLEDMTVTLKGPLIPTSHLSYPLGNPVLITQHQKQTAENFFNPFDLSGAPDLNEFSINVLSPDENTPRTAEILARVIATFPPPPGPTTGAPGTPLAPGSTGSPPESGSPAVTSAALPVGGTCTPGTALPNQCFNADGSAYVCCPAGCPDEPGAAPVCG